MSALVRSEWIKFRSIRSSWALTGIAVALSLLVAGISANTIDRHQSTYEVVSTGSGFLIVLLLVLGIQSIAQEYRFGTIRSSLTAVPRRTSFVAAKVVFGAAVGAVVGLLAAAGSLLVASVVLSGRGRSLPFDDRAVETLVALVAIAALAVVFGLGVGALTRSSALGITAVLLLMFVAENLVTVFVSEDMGSVLPFTAAFAAIPTSSMSNGIDPWWLALAVFAGWSVLVAVAGALAVEHRDS